MIRIFVAALVLSVFGACLQAQSLYKNIKIGDEDAPNELSIAFNPHNMGHMVLAANIDNYYISFDGGLSWSKRKVDSKFGVWGDPVVVFDRDENLYYFHLSLSNGYSNDRLICQKSTDGGISFNALDTFFGLNKPHMQDKEWATVDITEGPYKGRVYAFWTQCGQGEGDDFDVETNDEKTNKDRGVVNNPAVVPKQTDIFFCSTSDQGMTWTQPVTIDNVPGTACSEVGGTLLGVNSCIGTEGEVYTCWSSGKGIIFDRSRDGGNTWLTLDVTVDSLPKGFKYTVPGIYRCFGFPTIACDKTWGPNSGRIYVSWSDQRNGTTDTDVWLRYSDNGGDTWSKPIRVNDDDPGRHQFFSTMTIDEYTGKVYVLFYDRRNYEDEQTDVYLASSTNGGLSFKNEKISSTPFVPQEGTFFGDYIGIASAYGQVRPVWTRLDSTNLSIWTAIINEF